MWQQSQVRGLLLSVTLFSQRLLTYKRSKTCGDFSVAACTRPKNLFWDYYTKLQWLFLAFYLLTSSVFSIHVNHWLIWKVHLVLCTTEPVLGVIHDFSPMIFLLLLFVLLMSIRKIWYVIGENFLHLVKISPMNHFSSWYWSYVYVLCMYIYI